MSYRSDTVDVAVNHRRDRRKTATIKLVGWTPADLEALALDLAEPRAVPRLSPARGRAIAHRLGQALVLDEAGGTATVKGGG